MGNRKLWELYHLFVKRDIIGPISKSRYRSFGADSKLFKPYISDRNKDRVSIGDNTSIGKYSRIQCYPVFETGNHDNTYVNIGNNCIIGHCFTVLCGGNITIEDGVLIASDVFITSENHSINPEIDDYYWAQPLICRDVLIEEGCWIGEKACILPGVTIGKKSVIGAGSVVTKDIPDYCIAVGNPAKVIKKYDFREHRFKKI